MGKKTSEHSIMPKKEKKEVTIRTYEPELCILCLKTLSNHSLNPTPRNGGIRLPKGRAAQCGGLYAVRGELSFPRKKKNKVFLDFP